MTARIFISYRTSDGVDKATALARDLNAVFGDEQVFLDKEDLPAGRPWREAIDSTLGDKPVLLMLVTPQTFSARIADADDPVRREVSEALGCGAHVIPLLGDGVERLPDAQQMPEPLRVLGERTWRRLRAYDWREDIERLVDDLQQLGLTRKEGTGPDRGAERRRMLEVGAAFVVGGLAGGLGTAWWARRAATPPQARTDPAAALAGAWTLRAAAPAKPSGMILSAITLNVTQAGEELTLYSEPIDVARDPAWSEFSAHWRRLTGFTLERLVLRGAGKAALEQGTAPSIDMRLRFELPAGGDPIESGNLKATASADGQRLVGRLWLNGEQAERTMEMVRGR